MTIDVLISAHKSSNVTSVAGLHHCLQAVCQAWRVVAADPQVCPAEPLWLQVLLSSMRNMIITACCKMLLTSMGLNTGWLQVRRSCFIHHWQLLGCHGEPRQQQFYEVCDSGPALNGEHHAS